MKAVITNYESFSPFDLPFVEYLSKASLPESAGLYFIVADDHLIAYIGESQNIKKRLSNHPAFKFLRHLVAAKIYYYLFDGDEKKRHAPEPECDYDHENLLQGQACPQCGIVEGSDMK